jgi:hypothetical protein
MSDRRRPVTHLRRTATGLVEVNRDIHYGTTTPPAPHVSRRLASGVRQLRNCVDVIPPPPEHTGSMLTDGPVEVEAHLFNVPEGAMLKTRYDIDPAYGEGKIVMEVTGGGTTHLITLDVAPYMQSLQWNKNLDFRRANIPNASINGVITQCSYAEANLDRSEIGGVATTRPSWITNTSFEGASLRSTEFLYCDMDSVSFVGADGTGATFSITSYIAEVDITDSNIHPDQFTCDNVDDFNAARYLHYRWHTVSDVAEQLDVSEEEVAFLIWSGEIEVRDNATSEIVRNRYDAALHHIPQWEMQRLLR